MIYIKEKTEELLTMTPEQARELAKELNYMADETEDHEYSFSTELWMEGSLTTVKPMKIIIKNIDKNPETLFPR
jgi:hypothetical protein